MFMFEYNLEALLKQLIGLEVLFQDAGSLSSIIFGLTV